jgi:hypothetical protein
MGSYDDAVLAKCDMANGGWTVVEPRRASSPVRNFATGADEYRWFSSQMSGGFRFLYYFPSAQLSALQQVSTLGKQDLNFICVGVILYRNGGSLYSSATWFRPFGDAFMWNPSTYLGSFPYRIPIVDLSSDGCRLNDNVQRSTFLQFEGDPAVSLSARPTCISSSRSTADDYHLSLSFRPVAFWRRRACL